MQANEHSTKLFRSRWLIGGIILVSIVCGGWWWQQQTIAAAANPVNAAWGQARARGAYHFASDMTQVTTPLASLTTVGRTSRETDLHLEGATDLHAATMNLRLWTQEASVSQPNSGVEVRVLDGKTQMRQSGGVWQDAGDVMGGMAPSDDFLAFLAGMRDIKSLGTESRAGITFTRYHFQLDGPAIANYVRIQLEATMQKSGQLPPGLEVQAPASYAQMTGSGELWIDGNGLPLRQTLDLQFPAQRGEVVTANITTNFSDFAKAQPVAWLSPDQLKTLSLSSLGLFFGLACTAIVMTGRRSRRLYVALVIAIIFAELAGPLLQNFQISSFLDMQTARAADQAKQQSDQEMARQTSELVTKQTFNPNLDPLVAANVQAQAAAASVNVGPGLQPVPTPEPVTAPDNGVDTDKDGLTDFVEQRIGTSTTISDTDGDGISDGAEVKGFDYGGRHWFGDPLQRDSNNDGQPDTVEWHYQRDGQPVDLDGDGVPDAFDDDNDGDGVPDQFDLSPYSKMAPTSNNSAFNENTPFQLQLSNLQASKPVLVDFQLRPSSDKHLWYALSVLDWPHDVEGQIQDGDGKTYADLPGSNVNVNPSDANGDMKLVPMLEIRTPSASANLPSQKQLTAYGVAAHNLTSDGATQVIYVPLQLTTDSKTGARLAFSGRMPYQATGVWSQPQQVRLVWLVQALLDSCAKQVDGQCVQYNQINQPEVVQSYYDSWTLTGLTVREDHGAQTALIFEDPAHDADLKDDAGLVKLAYGLEHSFLAGRDQEPDGQLDVTMANISGSAARWGITDAFQFVQGNYATFDEAVMTTAMTTTKVMLDRNFKTAWNVDHSIKPLLLFAHEENYRSEGLDGLIAGGATHQQDTLLTVDFNAGGVPSPEQTSVGLKWTMFCGDATTGAWQGCDATTLWDEVYNRYAANTRLTLNGVTDDATTGQARLGLIRLYFLALSQGVNNIVKQDATILLPRDGFLRDDDVSASMRGGGTGAKGIVAFITSLATTKLELLTNDVIRQIAGLGAKEFVGGLGVGGIVTGRGVAKLKQLWAQSDRAKIGLVGGIVGVVLITLTLAATLAYFLATDPALRNTVVGTALNKVVPIVAVIVPLAGLAASVVPLVQLARGLQALASAQGSVSKLLRGSSALAGTSRISVAVGAVIQLVIVWGIFIYQMVSSHTTLFSPQFNAALAQAIAATVLILTLAVLSATVIGLIIVAVIAVIDAILTAICELGVDDLRKVPGLNGACFTLNTGATAGLAKLIYSFDSMVNTDRTDLVTSGGTTFTLADPSKGYVANNAISIGLGVTTTVVHKDPKPENVIHILPYIWLFSEDNLRGTTFKYELTQSSGNVNAARHQMDKEWSVSEDHRYAGKAMFRAQAHITPEIKNINLPAGINQAPTLYLNTGYALPAYECWSTAGLAQICYVRTLDGHNSTKIDQLKLDILPPSLDEFLAKADVGHGGFKLGWDSHFTTLADADGDGLRSLASQGNDPNDNTWDADGDGLSDAVELAWRANGMPVSALNWDTDGDGLSDAQELMLGTNPTVRDTDNDGLLDGDEVYHQVYAFDAASGAVKPTNQWAGGWTVAIPGSQPLNQIVSSDPLSPDSDGDGISDQAEKELATNADAAKRLDSDGRPYHPLLVNKNPLVVQVAINDADRIVKPGQTLVYSTSVTNLGAPFAAGGLEVRAPAILGLPYSTNRLELDQSNAVTKTTNFVVASAPSQQVNVNSFARARLVNQNPFPWKWLPPTFAPLLGSISTRFEFAATAPNNATRQDAFAVTAVKSNITQPVAVPNRDLTRGDVNAWTTAEGAFAALDQDNNDTTALRTTDGSDVACNTAGQCLYVWDQYATGAQRNLIVGALTAQNPTTVVHPQFALTQNPADAAANDYTPMVTSDGNNFLVVWERVTQRANGAAVDMISQVVTRLFNADGAPLGDEQIIGLFVVNPAQGAPVWRSYLKLDITWIGDGYWVALHEHDNLWIFGYASNGGFLGYGSIANDLDANSTPRLAYNPVNRRMVAAYVDKTLQMHVVFFEGATGKSNNAIFGQAANAALEIAYHPGTNDWLMAWNDANNQSLSYKLLKPDGVQDFTLATQFNTWPVAPLTGRMNLACPAATSQPVLLLPFEELPGATTFADVSGHSANATCADNHCPLAGIQGAPQAPDSDYGVLFDATKQQKLTAAVPGLSGGSFSIAFWFKIDGHKPMTLVAGDGWYLAFFPGTLYFKTAAGAAVVANVSTDDGNWHHVAMGVNNTTGTIYIDGIQRDTRLINQLTLPTPANLHIGSMADNSAFFSGVIDQLSVYAAPLDATSVDNLYNRRLNSACLLVGPAVDTQHDENAANDVGLVATARLNLQQQDVRGGVIQSSAGLSLTLDADAPTSSVTSLIDSSYVQGAPGGNQTMIIGGSAGDANGIQQVNVSVNGGGFQPASGGATWVYPLQLSEGRYAIQSQAVDVAGNVETAPRTTNILVDASAPQINTDFNENASLTPVALDAGHWQVSLQGTVNDPQIAGNPGSGVQQVDVLLQSADLNNTGNGWQPATLQDDIWSLNYTLASAPTLTGAYTVTVRAADAVGNLATLVRHVTLDEAGPAAALSAMDATRNTFAGGVNPANVSSSAVISAPLQIEGTASDADGVSAIEASFVPIQRIRAISDTLFFLPFDETSDDRVYHDISPMHTDVSCVLQCSAGQPGRNANSIHMIPNAAGPLARQQAGEFDFTANTSFSIQSWLRTAQADGVILSKEDIKQIGYALILQGGRAALRLNNRIVAQSDIAVNDNQWHQIVGVVDVSIGQVQLYVDGEIVGKDSFSGDLFDPNRRNSPFVLGGQQGEKGFTNLIDGWFDDVGVFKAALSPFLVQALYRTNDIVRQAATLGQPGAITTTWQIAVPEGLEGQYQIDLHTTDNLANQALQASAWRGVVDRSAPRLTFTAQPTGAQFDEGNGTTRYEIAYSYTAEDRYLSDANFSGPCDGRSALIRDFADDADVAGLFPDLTLRNRLSASCTVWEITQTPATTVNACDIFNSCATAMPTKPAIAAQASSVSVENVNASEPSALILSPTNQSIVAVDAETPLSVTFAAKADATLRSVVILLDREPVQTIDFTQQEALKTTQKTVLVKFPDFDADKFEGEHTLIAQASDWAGNVQQTLFPVTVLIDTHDPTVDLSNDKLTSADGYGLGNSMMRLHGKAADHFGLAAVQISINDGPFADVTFDDQGNWNTALWLGDEPAGKTYTFNLRAIDRAGHQTAMSKGLLVDVPPLATLQTAITAGPENPTQATTASFTFNGMDAEGNALTNFQCQLDGSAFTACISPQTYNDLRQGDHIFRVLATDGNGNIDPTPAEWFWQNGADAPTVSPNKIYLPLISRKLGEVTPENPTRPESEHLPVKFYLPLIQH